MNPVLVTVAAELGSCPSEDLQLPPAGVQRDAEVRYATLLCFVYHSFAGYVMEEPQGDQCLLARLVARVKTLKDTVDWGPYFNLFETAKVLSVHMPVDKWMLPLKLGTYAGDPSKEGSGWGITVNILEAVYQDASWGNEFNSACGFELMLEPPGRGPISGFMSTPLYTQHPYSRIPLLICTGAFRGYSYYSITKSGRTQFMCYPRFSLGHPSFIIIIILIIIICHC